MTDYRMTHEDAIDEAKRLSDGIPWHHVRRVAAMDLEIGWPKDEGMGSSDVSCHIASMVRSGELESAISPLRLIARTAESTGKTFDETFADFQLLFA